MQSSAFSSVNIRPRGPEGSGHCVVTCSLDYACGASRQGNGLVALAVTAGADSSPRMPNLVVA